MPSSTVPARGFSTSTGTPRSIAASAIAACAVVGVATTSASNATSSTIARASPKPCALVWRTAASSDASTGSASATSRTSGLEASNRRWFWDRPKPGQADAKWGPDDPLRRRGHQRATPDARAPTDARTASMTTS
jgi:hypothetical protein